MTAMGSSSPVYAAVGEKVRDFRRESGLSQKDLADMVACSRITISNLERGRQRISLELLHQIAIALSVELPALMPTRADLAPATPQESGVLETDPLSQRDRAVLNALAKELGESDEVE